MYYGNSSAPSQQSPSLVWDSNYKAVYHMNSDPTLSATCAIPGTFNLCDSTGNANNATRSAGTWASNQLVSGQIGNSVKFNGTNDYFFASHSASLQNSTDMTFSAWVYWAGGLQSYAEIMNKGSEDASDSYDMAIHVSDGFQVLEEDDSTRTLKDYQQTVNAPMTQGSWQYMTQVYDDTNNTVTLYRNGVSVGSFVLAAGDHLNSTFTNQLYIGFQNKHGAEDYWKDNMDEVHIQGTARTADWIITEYNNQSNPSSFYTFGNQQQKKNPVLYWKFDEGSGLTANDSSANAENGSISGATWVNKHVCLFESKCLQFNGTTSKVSRQFHNSDPWCNDPSGLTGCTASWSARTKITFSGNVSTTNLTNFPVLVKLDSTRIDYTKMRSDGHDLRFYDPSNNTSALPYEVEGTWNNGGTNYVWVQVPQIDANSTSDHIWMYYGNTAPPDAEQPTSVWDNSTALVEHLAETAACSISFKDSTTPTNPGSCNSAGPSVDASGQIGGARAFNGTTQFITIADDPVFDPDTTAFTFEAWVKKTTFSATGSIATHTDASGVAGWEIYQDTVVNTCGAGKLCFWDGHTDQGLTSGMSSSGTWYHIALSRTGTSLTMYVNGSSIGTLTVNSSFGTPPNGNVVYIGNDTGSTRFGGSMDEVRYATTNRSADWVKAEYITQTDAFNSFTPDTSYRGKDPLDEGANSFSVGAWFRHPAGGSGVQTIISRADAVNGVGYKINYDATNAQLCFGIDDTAGVFASSDKACSNQSYSDNMWHYVEGVKNGTSSITLYVDGKLVSTDSSLASTGSLSGASPTFYVGMDADGTSNPWTGYLDEIRVYDYARSLSEVQADFNAKGAVLGLSTSVGITDQEIPSTTG